MKDKDLFDLITSLALPSPAITTLYCFLHFFFFLLFIYLFTRGPAYSARLGPCLPPRDASRAPWTLPAPRPLREPLLICDTGYRNITGLL